MVKLGTVQEIMKKYSAEELEQALLTMANDGKYKKCKPLLNRDAIFDFCKAFLANSKREKVLVVFCNNLLKVIEVKTMFTGTSNSCAVYPKEIAKKALELNAESVFIAHNHPAGSREFSNHDKAITVEIIRALRTLSIGVNDHILICKTANGLTTLKSMAQIHPEVMIG